MLLLGITLLFSPALSITATVGVLRRSEEIVFNMSYRKNARVRVLCKTFLCLSLAPRNTGRTTPSRWTANGVGSGAEEMLMFPRERARMTMI